MTISGALSNALSGLNASSRTADVVSANLANVLTDGYAVRDIELASQRDGRGVAVVGITRHVDSGLLGDRRLADSGRAAAETRAGFAAQIEQALGTPGETGALSTRLAQLDASLVTASTRPEEANRLQTVVRDAASLGESLNRISDRIEVLRSRADSDIARTVDSVNTGLEQVSTLNKQITQALFNGRATAPLEDQRQKVIDGLAEFLPLRQLPRDHGAVALVTTGGALVLDGLPAKLEFEPSAIVAPHMTLENGLLSGIKINGNSVNISGGRGPLAGGQLAALFDIRDDLAVTAQSGVDAVARDLVERFQQVGLDPSLAPGAAGLFTDAGTAFDPANEVGLAGRISLNAAVDPDRGGAMFRLRDGLGATTPGPAGDSALLQAFSAALRENRALPSGPLGSTARSAAGQIATLVSQTAQNRLAEDQTLSFTTSQASELRSLELANGVDSDAELQRLLLVEQAFSANARMIQTIDDMMQTLLRI
ncbi:MAG: flagellar hook-associated protein FlgK [Roseovarius sp.]|nr:flagellar hook-associated protein FlgK [Roseovarius sp.]